MAMTEDEAFMLSEALRRIQQLEATQGRWRVNGADGFFQESGFRFGQRVDIGDLGIQIVPKANESLGLAFLDDFVAQAGYDLWVQQNFISGIYGALDLDPNGTDGEVSVTVRAEADGSGGLSQANLEATTTNYRGRILALANETSGAFYVALDETPLLLGLFTSDPAVVADGMILGYRTDTDKFRGRANGATDNFAMEAWVTAGFVAAGTVILGAGSELTIASGAITITSGYHRVDTQSDAASDELDTISGGTTGQLLVLRAENAARTVVVKDNTGNIQLDGSADFSLDAVEDTITLIYNGSAWLEISRSDNA